MSGEPPGPLCGDKLGENWIDDGTNCRRRSPSTKPVGHHSSAEIRRRKLAASLHAENAIALLKLKLPYVIKGMTEAQLDHMQTVFDAAVVDPEIQKEADIYYKRAGVWMDNGYAIWDEAAKRKADKIMEGFITVGEWDKRIRLDYKKLLEPQALDPVTDNPDEATYLKDVRKTLDKKGVWLRYGQKLVRDPEDPSAHIYDPHQFEVWLSLGADGDTIPSKDGKLTHEALLNTMELGAGYYDRVYLGPVQRKLENEMARLDNQISAGQAEHRAQSQIRAGSPIVAKISDTLGGANFPDYSIWDPPFKMFLQAKEMNIGGNVRASQAYIVAAAILTRTCAQVLAAYIEDTTSGAERAVKVLKVAKTAGEVAGVALTVTGVVAVARVGVAAAAEGAAGTSSEVDALAKKVVDKYVADNPGLADELKEIRWVKGPKGSIGGFVKPGHSYGLGTGWQQWP
jgi:hypothetical protein